TSLFVILIKHPTRLNDPPQDCPKCGNPYDGLYCRHCALLRKKLKEQKVSKDFLNTSESSNEDSNVVNIPQDLIVFNQDPGAHYGYNCLPKVLIITNPEPCHDQNVEEFPQTLPSFHPSCYSGDENSFAYDSTPNLVNDSPNAFNPPSQPPMYSYEFCGNDAQYGHDCPPQLPFDNFQPSQPVIDHLNLQQRINDSMIELRRTFQAWLQQRKDQVCQKIPLCYDDDDDEESSTPLRDIIIFELPPCITITPVLSTKDSLIVRDEHLGTILEKESNEFIKPSVENLIPNPSESEDERECDVPACDDFITFSNILFDAENDFSSSDDESFSDEDIPKEIYLNPLFDEEIISIKIDPNHLNVESGLIESLLNQDSSIISSSKIDSLLDEFAGELILLKSIPPGIDKADCDPKEEIRLIRKLLYDNSSPHPPKKIISENSDAAIKSFSPSPIHVEDSDSLMEEITLSLTPDDSMPPGIKNDDYDSEGDMLILEELLSNDSLSLSKNDSFHFNIPSSPRPPAKPPDDDEIEPNSGIFTVKVGLKTFQLSSESPMMVYGGNIPILDVLPSLSNSSMGESGQAK
nr:hypothetical protein [Tanacetum cinerariifolium]